MSEELLRLKSWSKVAEMVQIIPAILSTSEEDFDRDILRYGQSSFKEGWIHIDFADNIFVPNKTIGPSQVAKYPIDLQKEAHLMVQHPLEWIDGLQTAGFERIVFHIEAEDSVEKCIESIKSKGISAGLAIKNETPIEKLEPFIDKLDTVLVMGIEPGFQGKKFIPATLDKIRQLKSKGWQVKIGVDGSVKNDNIKEIVEAGVDFVIVGSYLLKGDINENLESLWKAIRK